MTQAINQLIISENILLDKFRNLTIEQQQTILDFVEFMDSKKPKLPASQEVSAYDLAKEWAGCVKSGRVKTRETKYNLQDLLSKVTPENSHCEIYTGNAIGSEVF